MSDRESWCPIKTEFLDDFFINSLIPQNSQQKQIYQYETPTSNFIMIKFLLIIAVVASASVMVESVASSTFKEYCDAKFKLVEDLPIKSYIVSRLPGKPNVYIRTDVNNGVYQIEYNVGGDAKLIHQQQLIQEFAWNSFTAGQPINLCVDASTTPSTIHMIEGGYGLKVVDVKPAA